MVDLLTECEVGYGNYKVTFRRLKSAQKWVARRQNRNRWLSFVLESTMDKELRIMDDIGSAGIIRFPGRDPADTDSRTINPLLQLGGD
jgi:hypothetical protein